MSNTQKILDILAHYPGSQFVVIPSATADVPPDDYQAFIAHWFDGEHEAPALQVDADTPEAALAELLDFIVNEAVI